MKKVYIEVFLVTLFVVGATLTMYNSLAQFNTFWSAQLVWNIALLVCWTVVALGYYNQGFIVRNSQSALNVSYILPIAVFFVQCILFIKGIFYHDWSLLIGAVMVNSGVLFSLFQIIRFKR